MKIRSISLLASIAILLLSGASPGRAESPKKPDYITYNSDGSVKTRGVYETNSAGKVTKFTVYRGDGKLNYTEVAYYAPNGKIIRSDHLDSSGKVEFVAVYFEESLTVLDSHGKYLKSMPYPP